MVEVGARVHLRDALGGLKGLSRQADRGRKAFFESIKKPVKDDVKKHQKERRAETSSWPALAPATRRRRMSAKGRRQRGMLGRVPRAWKSYISTDHFKLRNMIRWAAIHDEGGMAGRGARIPRRHFSYVGRGLLSDIEAIWHDNVMKGWR